MVFLVLRPLIKSHLVIEVQTMNPILCAEHIKGNPQSFKN